MVTAANLVHRELISKQWIDFDKLELSIEQRSLKDLLCTQILKVYIALRREVSKSLTEKEVSDFRRL